MANYADAARTPRTLTEREQRALLKVTGEHRAGFRDHVLYAMALGTGLREHELIALSVEMSAFSQRADRVSPSGRRPRFACTWTPRAPTITPTIRPTRRPERVTSVSAWTARRTKDCPDAGSTTARSGASSTT
jgi:integrase